MRKSLTQPRALVLYRGPSMLNGAPIVAIGLLPASANRKTGAMLQTYILADNGIRPSANLKTGGDAAVCGGDSKGGGCKHRPINGGACYVVVAQGPTVVYKSYIAGKYPMATDSAHMAELGRDRMIRLGTYGDPAAVPSHIWMNLLMHSSGRTGYTHQWQSPIGQALKPYVMASCDTPEERTEAQSDAWRTFTVRMPNEPLAARESVCPASEEAGKKLTCIKCGMCNGAESGRKGSIAIIAHGGGGQLKKFIAIRHAQSSQNAI